MIFNVKRSWAVVLICTMMVVGTLSVTPFASSGIDNNFEVSNAANMPHIFAIDFWDQNAGIPSPSLLNTEVDVDNTYTFFIEANYTVGGIENWTAAEVELCAWYDEGKIGSNSSPEGSWATAENRTRQFRIVYNVLAGIPTINYPVGGSNEFSILNWWEDPNTYGPDLSHHRLYINVTFEKQTWAADGNGFPNGAAVDINLINSALTDVYSWDFNYSVYNWVMPSARNDSYEEFGIKPLVAISAAGNPSGNAPPGSADVALVPQSMITYSANTNYTVNVSIPNLLRDGVGPAMISATDISVRNEHLTATDMYTDINGTWPVGRPFLGAGIEYSVWGNSTTGMVMPTPLNGTAAAGVWCTDYSAPIPGVDDVTLVNWWATIPAGTPEGSYWAQITYTIESQDGSFAAMDLSTQIRVNVAFPHIYYIDIWDQSEGIPGPSLLNTEVDADNTYTFFVESNYTVGGVDRWFDAELELSAWYDGGNVGSASMPPDPTWSMPWARTQQFRLHYNVMNNTAWMDYPTGAPFEFSIDSWWEDPNTYSDYTADNSEHHLYINVTFSNQTYAADGDGFINGPAWGGMISDKNMALNDANSWDFNLAIYDSVFPSARNDSYEEFGVGNSSIPQPSMNINKWAPPTTSPGDYLNYIIYFNNTGTDTIDHVWINDTLPLGVIYISDTAAVSPYFMSSNIVGQTLYYEFANVPPGSYSFTVTVYINPSVADGTILTNHVTCDYAPSGNQTEDWANTTVIRPVITVEKTVDMTLASPGDFLTYYIWFNNTGSANTEFVWINDTLPGGVTYLSDTSTTSPTSAPYFLSRSISGQNLQYTFANVPPGVHSFEITVQIDSGVANGTVLTNWVFCNYTAPNGQSLEETSDFATTLVGAGDSAPPSHSNEIPGINGQTNDPTPVISVHVTDPSGVDASTIRLYIDGFMIFYDLMDVPDGYNVSYWHSMGFANGQVVVCRIVADDTLGNHLDFTWTFTVDLTAPWVVWTDPGDGQQDVPFDYNITVGFSEAMDPLRTPQGFSISPPVNGSFWWDGNSTTTMAFDPFGLLEWNTTYYVTINVLARDLAGNNMLADYTWSFTTEDTDHDPPEHSNESPAINGYTTVLDPTISVHVTDISEVNTSKIKFYINGYRIFHNLASIANGYNISYWHESGFSPGEVVTCRIMAEDMLGNLLDFTWQFTVGSSFEIALHDGWNLVSFPLIPMNTSIEEVLSSISGQWDMVEYYDASDLADHWKSYATFMPSSLNDLWNLDNTMGFWLHATNVTTLVIYGTEPTSTVIPLYIGWNMVGYPSLVNRTVEDALADLPWDSVEVEDQNASYTVSPIGPTDIMTAGKGYWVHVTDDCVWGVGYTFAPPTDVWAELCGANLTDLKISWTKSLDDGAGQFCITGYDIYYSSNFSNDGTGYLILDSVGAGVEEYMLSGWGKGDPSCYYFYVTAKSLNNEVMSPTQSGKFVYDLFQNWSLLSFPLILQNTSIPSIFTSLGNTWDIALSYDSSPGEGWKSYATFKPPILNDLWNIDHTMGFRLHVNLSMSPEFVIAGQVPRIIRIQLNTDWNMIGFPSLIPMTVGEAFIGLPYNETLADDPAIDDMFATINLSGSDYLNTGQGYWIRVTESCTWLRFW